MSFKLGESVVVPHKKTIEQIEFIENIEDVEIIYTTSRCSYASHQVRGVLEYAESVYGIKSKLKVK